MIGPVKVPKDKVKHLLAGCVVMVICALIIPGVWWAALVPLAVGVLKEAWDELTGRGTVDPWDAVATGLPGIPLALIAI